MLVVAPDIRLSGSMRVGQRLPHLVSLAKPLLRLPVLRCLPGALIACDSLGRFRFCSFVNADHRGVVNTAEVCDRSAWVELDASAEVRLNKFCTRLPS